MIESLLPWLANTLVVFGLLGMTSALVGMYWLPDLYTKLHAASKVMVIGVIPMFLALLETGEAQIVSRAILIIAVLFFTTPFSAHILARAAYLKKEPMETPDVVDQSGRLAVKGSTAKHGDS